MIVHSKLKFVWPDFGFTLEVGRNEIGKLPEAGKETIKRKLMALAKAGVITIEKPNERGGLPAPVSGVPAD